MGKRTGLAKGQLRALARLSRVQELSGFYLAGGTAIAHHLGHRRSRDLDVFSGSKSADLAGIRLALTRGPTKVVVVGESDATLQLRFGGELLDIVRYPFPLLEAPRAGPGDFPVAGLRDLVAMKLAATARRGVRRDFWDVYAIASQGLSLREAGLAYVARFGVRQSDLYHVARALTYFADADREAAFPSGLTRAGWAEIKAFFLREAPTLLEDTTRA